MTDAEKVQFYEMQISSILQTVQSEYNSFEGKNLSEFEQGRKFAYFEVVDTIKNQYGILLEMLNE